MRFKQVTVCKKMNGSPEHRRFVLEGQSKVAKNRETGKKKMSRGRMKLKKKAVLSGLHAHEELVRE